jgi:hypothetical protein
VDPLAAANLRFSADYRQARQRFRAAAGAAGGELRAYDNPHRGPHGEVLAVDCAWFGPISAEKVLVILSGTHGVEGFCGSGVQLDWLEEGHAARLPPGHAALLAHAVNPHGFAWVRRVTEENVDLNRNFVDFAGKLPENPAYDEVAEALVPRSLDAGEWAKADAAIESYRKTHGELALYTARTAGQYRHPEGIFYGGASPTWARRTEEAMLVDYRLEQRRHVAVIDLHTGLGPFGYGDLIMTQPPASASGRRMLSWYDSVTELGDPNSGVTMRVGLCGQMWEALLGERVSFVTLEFGTRPRPVVFAALRGDHSLHRGTNLDWDAPQTQRIKDAIKDAFFPDSVAWREMVLMRGRQVLRQAQAGLERA